MPWCRPWLDRKRRAPRAATGGKRATSESHNTNNTFIHHERKQRELESKRRLREEMSLQKTRGLSREAARPAKALNTYIPQGEAKPIPALECVVCRHVAATYAQLLYSLPNKFASTSNARTNLGERHTKQHPEVNLGPLPKRKKNNRFALRVLLRPATAVSTLPCQKGLSHNTLYLLCALEFSSEYIPACACGRGWQCPTRS